EPRRNLPERDRGENQHEGHEQPERAAPPIDRGEEPADDRAAQMADGEGPLRDGEDAGAKPRVVKAGDEREGAARDEAAGPALDAARGDEREHLGRERASRGAEREDGGAQRIAFPRAKAR